MKTVNINRTLSFMCAAGQILRYVKAQCAASPESDSAKTLASFGKEFMAYERRGDLKFCVTYDILSLRLGTSFYDDWAGTLFPDFVV